ncbi:MAG: DUF6326 family protein [Polyangiaceae bacterium]
MRVTQTAYDPRPLIRSLWVFAVFNYLYADVIGLMDRRLLQQYLRGEVDSLHITPGFLFAAAVLMELPIAMTLLTRVLPARGSRWSNIAVGALKTCAVAATFCVGSLTAYYVFFSLIEIATTLFIVVLAWRWRVPR